MGEWPAALCERGVSEMTRARAECERRLLAVKAGLADIGEHADKVCADKRCAFALVANTLADIWSEVSYGEGQGLLLCKVSVTDGMDRV